jgi:hypothetical protein
MLTLYGACAVTFMMPMYALEARGRGFILAFACGCVLSSAYGFLSGAWPFGGGRVDLVRRRRSPFPAPSSHREAPTRQGIPPRLDPHANICSRYT